MVQAICLAPLALGQVEPTALRLESRDSMPPATLADVSWLAGHWRGEMFGGIAEALWAPPMGGSMMGSYRLIEDGAVTFYELIIIVEDNGSLIMKVKHFHPDLIGWEEKEGMHEFPLVQVTADAIFFDGLTYIKDDEDTRRVVLLVGREDGGVEEVEFTYHRVER
jgi:hypothetical protein